MYGRPRKSSCCVFPTANRNHNILQDLWPQFANGPWEVLLRYSDVHLNFM